MARALKIETREKEDNALDALCRLIATQTGHGHVRPKHSRTPGARARVQGTAGPSRRVDAFRRWVGYLFG